MMIAPDLSWRVEFLHIGTGAGERSTNIVRTGVAIYF